MTAPRQEPGDTPPALADRIADQVLDHPSVRRLDAGRFGTVASYLPGRKVTGVRAGEAGEPVEVAVVLRLDRPLPDIVADLRARVTAVTGPVTVDITVSDVLTEQESSEDVAEPGG